MLGFSSSQVHQPCCFPPLLPTQTPFWACGWCEFVLTCLYFVVHEDTLSPSIWFCYTRCSVFMGEFRELSKPGCHSPQSRWPVESSENSCLITVDCLSRRKDPLYLRSSTSTSVKHPREVNLLTQVQMSSLAPEPRQGPQCSFLI